MMGVECCLKCSCMRWAQPSTYSLLNLPLLCRICHASSAYCYSTFQEMGVVCMIKHTGLWLGSVSFTLFFVPIAAKTWRVHRIFSDAAVKGRVRLEKLLGHHCCLGEVVQFSPLLSFAFITTWLLVRRLLYILQIYILFIHVQ